jgi:hypothetical protein
MLSGELTGLRARTGDDAEILHEELYGDVEGWVRASNRPWVPIAPGPGSPYAAADPADERRGPAPDAAEFSIVELASGELAGQVGLWGIDEHNRMAHVGVELRPGFRGGRRGPRRVPLRVLASRTAPAAAGDPGRQPRDDRGRGPAGVHPRGSDPRLVLAERQVYGRCHLRAAGRGVRRLKLRQSVLIIHSAAYACTSVCARGRLEIRRCAHPIHSYPQL